MDELITKTDLAAVKKARRCQALVVCIILTVCNLLLLSVSAVLFLLVEIVIFAISSIPIWLPGGKQDDWTLHFAHDKLYVINNRSRQNYVIYSVPTTDFCFKQTKANIQADEATMTVKNTVFAFPCVENITAVKAYIQVHFSKSTLAEKRIQGEL